MPKNSATTIQLGALVSKLQEERRTHLNAIAVIDATFEQFGITVAAVKRRGRPARTARVVPPVAAAKKAARKASKGRGKRGRVQYATTAEQSILSLVKAAGRQGVSGADIVKHWKAE